MSETPVIYEAESGGQKMPRPTFIEEANELTITDKASFDKAVELGLELAREIKQIKEKWEPLVEASKIAYETNRNAMQSELEPRCKAQTYLSKERVMYKVEQDRLARIEQARLEREAHEKAEKERQKLLDKACATKDSKKVEELLEKAEQIYAPPVFAESAMPKTIKSESGSITWVKDIEVTVDNPRMVCIAIGNGIIPETCVEFKNLKQWVKLNNIKEVKGLCIKEIQRESKRIS